MRDELFQDPGDGVFKRSPREFVLSEPALNLWSGIREDAIGYFEGNQISWWDAGNEPTGHLLSSQIACVNHLYFIRQREDCATAILKQISPDIESALSLSSGFVEFEMVGQEKLGGEKLLKRGVNCTSIDAMMLGVTKAGESILFLIEWKYTESYNSEPKWKGDSGQVRLDAYDQLLAAEDCPIVIEDKKALFYEPFYQLMRQTLLGWEMVKRKEYKATNWLHVHVIPKDNLELKNKVPSPGLSGETMEDAWRNVLKEPDKYVVFDPVDLLQLIQIIPDTRSILAYLKKRYGCEEPIPG